MIRVFDDGQRDSSGRRDPVVVRHDDVEFVGADIDGSQIESELPIVPEIRVFARERCAGGELPVIRLGSAACLEVVVPRVLIVQVGRNHHLQFRRFDDEDARHRGEE